MGPHRSRERVREGHGGDRAESQLQYVADGGCATAAAEARRASLGDSEGTVNSSRASSAITASGASRCRSTGSSNSCTAGAGPSRALALEEADDQKAAYLRKGGILIA
jgi:hypothetical protein